MNKLRILAADACSFTAQDMHNLAVLNGEAPTTPTDAGFARVFICVATLVQAMKWAQRASVTVHGMQVVPTDGPVPSMGTGFTMEFGEMLGRMTMLALMMDEKEVQGLHGLVQRTNDMAMSASDSVQHELTTAQILYIRAARRAYLEFKALGELEK